MLVCVWCLCVKFFEERKKREEKQRRRAVAFIYERRRRGRRWRTIHQYRGGGAGGGENRRLTILIGCPDVDRWFFFWNRLRGSGTLAAHQASRRRNDETRSQEPRKTPTLQTTSAKKKQTKQRQKSYTNKVAENLRNPRIEKFFFQWKLDWSAIE